MDTVKIRLKEGKKQSNYNKLSKGAILEVEKRFWDSKSSYPRSAKLLEGSSSNSWDYKYYAKGRYIEVNLLHFEEIVDGDSYDIF